MRWSWSVSLSVDECRRMHCGWHEHTQQEETHAPRREERRSSPARRPSGRPRASPSTGPRGASCARSRPGTAAPSRPPGAARPSQESRQTSSVPARRSGACRAWSRPAGQSSAPRAAGGGTAAGTTGVSGAKRRRGRTWSALARPSSAARTTRRASMQRLVRGRGEPWFPRRRSG